MSFRNLTKLYLLEKLFNISIYSEYIFSDPPFDDTMSNETYHPVCEPPGTAGKFILLPEHVDIISDAFEE
jgi:hypothetical protein